MTTSSPPTEDSYRPEFPADMPRRIAALPVHRGYPTPWFVGWFDAARPVERGEGIPDFRVLHPTAIRDALRDRLCWICGQPFALGATQAFVLGPMCAVNRTSGEPPSHPACADWAARACPFLSRPHMERRTAGLPQDTGEPAGTMLRRNPGVSLLWASAGKQGTPYGGNDGWRTFAVANGFLFNVGEPVGIRWYAEGRAATRDEVMASIESGFPSLVELAELEEGGREMLAEKLALALVLVPAA